MKDTLRTCFELVLILIIILLATNTHTSKTVLPTTPVVSSHKTVCPHYEIIKSVSSKYSGAWSGTVITITMTDGSTYQSQYNQVNNYPGQRICSTDLRGL
jgi:hypothetical protein